MLKPGAWRAAVEGLCEGWPGRLGVICRHRQAVHVPPGLQVVQAIEDNAEAWGRGSTRGGWQAPQTAPVEPVRGSMATAQALHPVSGGVPLFLVPLISAFSQGSPPTCQATPHTAPPLLRSTPLRSTPRPLPRPTFDVVHPKLWLLHVGVVRCDGGLRLDGPADITGEQGVALEILLHTLAGGLSTCRLATCTSSASCVSQRLLPAPPGRAPPGTRIKGHSAPTHPLALTQPLPT